MNNKSDLCILAEKYGVDKCPKILHSYTPEYDKILRPIKDRVKTFVEIGIGNAHLMMPIVGNDYKPGASLRMWRDYFVNANIIGLDILPEVLFTEERITTFLVDQSNESSLKNFGECIKNADIIIDDGSHNEKDMILSFKTLWKYINIGGLYIIEDIKLNSLPIFQKISKVLGFKDAKLIYSHSGRTDWDSFVIFQKFE
jgi:hypothetical protein